MHPNAITIEQLSQCDWIGLPDNLDALVHAPGKPFSEQEKKRASMMLGNWIRGRHKDLFEKLCFIDLVFYNTMHGRDSANYLLFTPTKDIGSKYKDAVDELVGYVNGPRNPLVLDRCSSIGAHHAFLAGLPAEDTEIYRTQLNSPRSGNEVSPTKRHLLRVSWEGVSSDSQSSRDEEWYLDTISVGANESAKTISEESSKKTLDENVRAFVNILTQQDRSIADQKGRHLQCFICVPLNAAMSDEKGMNSSSQNVAQAFAGFSVNPDEEELKRFLTDISLLTFAAYAGNVGHRFGLEKGTEDAIEIFAHQVKAVANAMTDRWTVSLNDWDTIKGCFKNDNDAIRHLANARVVPAPQLYEAIRKTLVLWSQTRRLLDLYHSPPYTIEDVVNRAWKLANAAILADRAKTTNLSSSLGDIRKAWSFEEDLVFSPTVSGDVRASMLIGDFLNKDTQRQAEAWLCALTRYMVAVFDNYWNHADLSIPPAIEVEVTASDVATTMSLSVIDIIRGDTRDDSRLRIGMNGMDVLCALARQLGAQIFPPNEPLEVGGKYILTIRCQIPQGISTKPAK